jgi:HemX protein
MVDYPSITTGLRILVPALYLIVAIGYVIEFVKNRSAHFFWTKPLLITGILLHILFFAWLFFLHNSLPYDTIFKGLLAISLIVSLLYLGMEQFIGDMRYGAFLFPVNFIIAAAAMFYLDRGVPLPRALHSGYFFAHTSLLFLAYACFLLSFVISVMYLFQHRQIKKRHLGRLFERLPSLADMDQAIMRVDALGLGLLVVGLAAGFLWMEMIIGVPSHISLKIGLSCLILLVYLSEHLLRIGKGWNGQRACWISIAGFCFVIITLIAGRHGY